jgi:hypothetical protein
MLTHGRDWRESADPLNPCTARAQRAPFYSELVVLVKGRGEEMLWKCGKSSWGLEIGCWKLDRSSFESPTSNIQKKNAPR